MAWDLDTAKIYLGIDPADTSKDVQIQGVLDHTKGMIELALQREIERAEFTEVYEPRGLPKVLLRQFPVEEVREIDGDLELGDYTLVHRTGELIKLELAGLDQTTIRYVGGFDPIPAQLERAMWEVFLVEWGNTDENTGGPSAGAGAGSGDVKAVTIFDGFKVDYQTAGSTGDDAGAAAEAAWGRLAPWASILAFYRSGPAGTNLGMA